MATGELAPGLLSPSRPSDPEWVAFLQWCLPRLELRWEGFRQVRRQVCRRIWQRMRELGLRELTDYRRLLELGRDEWRELDPLCRVTISRFGRDRSVFENLQRRVLPQLALRVDERGERTVRCWSAGCASGEEPYSLRLLWELTLRRQHPDLDLEVVATDVDEHVLRRAEVARYPQSSLRDLPEEWQSVFACSGSEAFLPQQILNGVRLLRQDVREKVPDGRFSLILCRNLVFTYFSDASQRSVLRRLLAALEPGGVLVVGVHERLPRDVPGLDLVAPCIWERASSMRG